MLVIVWVRSVIQIQDINAITIVKYLSPAVKRLQQVCKISLPWIRAGSHLLFSSSPEIPLDCLY